MPTSHSIPEGVFIAIGNSPIAIEAARASSYRIGAWNARETCACGCNARPWMPVLVDESRPHRPIAVGIGSHEIHSGLLPEVPTLSLNWAGVLATYDFDEDGFVSGQASCRKLQRSPESRSTPVVARTELYTAFNAARLVLGLAPVDADILILR